MKVIAIDFDNTIYKDGKVINKEKVNELFEDKDNFIVIYTSRTYSQFFVIKKILDENGVRYHSIVCEKIRSDVYIDDRNVGGLRW